MKNSILGKARWLREVALATSKNNGARVAHEWLKYATMFVMLLTLGSGNAWGAIASGTYVLCTSTNDLEAGAHYIIASGTSGTVYCISNESNSNNRKTASAIVSSSKITVASNSPIMTFTLGGDDTNGWTFSTDNYGGTAGMLAATSSSSNRLGVVASPGNNGKWAITFSSNLAKPVAKGTYTRKYMKYNYNSGSPIFNCYSSSGSESVYIYKLAASCDNKVTISKGSETNGTFTLDKTGEQNACDALSVTVTPSPAEHFHVASVSATNPATTGTAGEAVDNGDGTWTITYSANSKGASTVNVTFEEDTKHTLTFYNNGAQVEQIQVYDGEKIGASLPSLTSNEACHATSQTFAGWTTENIGSTPVHTVDVGQIVDYWTKPTGDMTIYAIWATIPASATTTFAAADYSAATAPITKEKDNITLYFDAGSIYKSKTPYTFTITSGDHYFSITASNKVLAKLETTCNNGTYCLYSVSDGTLSPNSSTASQTVTGINTYNVECYPKNNNQIRMQTCAVYCYDNYITTCQACVAPTSVTITGTNMYLGGQTISLTAAPEGGTGEPSYQWQKKISGVWKNLANDGSISGVTSNNLQISSCSYVNSGGYRCIVSTGDGCETKSHADDTNGYGVHVFSLTGGYSGGDWSAHDITWTSGTTGTATIHLNASSTYMFKVFSNNDYYYGNGENNYIIQPVSWDCGINNHDMRLFTGPEGDYTFTVNIEHGLDGSPYVNVQVGYPAVSHPSTGYIYISKWWDCYVHYWEGTNNALMPWGSDPKIDADRYATICGNDYWYFPVIATYNKFIAKDKAGDPTNTTGDQVTTNHGGMYITHNGSNWVWGNFATYTIAYAGGDGSTGGPMASHTGLCPGSSQQLTANAFSKSGYNFSGWTANVDVKIGGSTVPAGTLITGTPIIENVQSNITLTAQWTATTYTITYNGVKTGAENTNPTSYTVEDLPINLVAATHDQWRFDGWTDDNAGNADITTIPAGTTGNQSFTAHWTQRYAVTWYEESTPTIEYYDPGTTLQFPADPSAPASCSEKKFVGWMVGTIEGETDDKPTFITAGEVNADAAYHAVWANSAGSAIAAVEDNTFTQSDVSKATYCGVGNGLQSVGKYVQNQSIWNASQMTGVNVKIKVYHVSNNRADVLRISLINSSGEEVVGTDLTTSKLGNSSSFAGYSSNVTLTPTTAVTGYKVSLKTKNSSGTSVGKVTREVVPAYSKYSTSCCDNNVAAPSVTATATRNSITLSWANVTGATGYKVTINGGTHDVTTAACTYMESGLTSGTDYAWTVVATYNPANYCGAIPTKNTTTTLSVYGVTYNKNTTIGSGTVTMSPMPSDASTYVVGENVTAAAKPTTCTNSGYTFNGWNTEPDGTGTHVDAGGTIAMVEGGLTLYAEWVAKRAYYVDRMHGQGDQTIEIGGKTYHCYYGDGYHITPSPSDQKSGDACQAPHYRFVRWLTIGHINADGTQKDTGGAVSGGVQRGTVTDGETYYAIWEEEIE